MEYPMNEDDADIEAAKKILDAASNLKGPDFPQNTEVASLENAGYFRS